MARMRSSDGGPARLTDHPSLCALLGGVVGALAAATLGWAGLLPAAPRGGSSAALGAGAGAPAEAAFLAAWRTHLEASWSVEEIDERTTTSGASLRFSIHRAQAPPDSVEIGGGTVAARRGAVELACGPAPAGPGQPGAGHAGAGLTCRSAAAPATWAQDVDAQIAALRAAASGPRAIYTVAAGAPGCWTFSLKIPDATVPVALGRRATYCLDPTTGALRSSVIQRVGAIDRVTTTESHAPATAADLALPPGAALAGAPGG